MTFRAKIQEALRTEQGFNLIEMMVAIGILSFGVLAVASMQESSLLGSNRANSATQVTAVAIDRLERLMAYPFRTWTGAKAPTYAPTSEELNEFFPEGEVPTHPSIESVTFKVSPGPDLVSTTSVKIEVEVKAKGMKNAIQLTGLKTRM